MKPHKVLVVVISAAAVYGIWRRYRASNKVDRLSEVPDGVLLHILSYMSLCDVARMSMLSRKWRNLCLDIPSLELNWYELSGAPNDGSHSVIYTETYVKRVDQVLHKYRDQKTFKSFSLVCCLKFNFANEVNRWINFVAANNVTLQSLTLHFICRQEGFRGLVYPTYTKLHVISGSFLSQFSYLQDLHLDSCVLKLENNDLILSRNLTSLDLYNVNLIGPVTRWQDILSNCSSTIECLELKMCNLPNKLCIGNNFLRLSFLKIGQCSSLQELELSARKLKKFEYYGGHGEQALKWTFKNVSNLESVHMFVNCGTEYALERLAVGTSPKYLGLRAYDPLMSKLPTSPHKLFHSVLKLRISSVFGDSSIVPALPCLIKSFPQLEKLDIEFPKKTGCQRCELPPVYIHNNLKEIKLLGFTLAWIPFASYLLQSALVLDRMVITKSFTSEGGMRPKEYIKIIPFTSTEPQFILNSLSGKASSANVDIHGRQLQNIIETLFNTTFV